MTEKVCNTVESMIEKVCNTVAEAVLRATDKHYTALRRHQALPRSRRTKMDGGVRQG